MKINKKQFEKMKNLMPTERKPVKISNQHFLLVLAELVLDRILNKRAAYQLIH